MCCHVPYLVTDRQGGASAAPRLQAAARRPCPGGRPGDRAGTAAAAAAPTNKRGAHRVRAESDCAATTNPSRFFFFFFVNISSSSFRPGFSRSQ